MTETARAPERGPAEQRTLYMVGNAHIDPVWLWRWQDGLSEVRSTFASALERIEEYEDFVFTCDSVAYLAWIEKVDPALFARIGERIAQGRFEVVGGWWIEPDCNIPSGESFVRQALYAQRFLHDRFGKIATVGCNVDPFGHNASLPQLLKKSGIDAYLFLRPEPSEKTLPAELFFWEGTEGSRVLAYRIPYGYCSPGTALDEFIAHALERTDAPQGDGEAMILYGVGNHGGGPTRANIDSILRLDAEDNGMHLVLSGPRRYFDTVVRRDTVPSYVGDLQHHAVGCYSAHSGIKAWNRRAENELCAAERFAVLAERLVDVAYPSARLEEAWRAVLFNQFHDTLAGTAIASAYEDARDQYGYARAIAASVTNLSLQAIAARVAIPAEADTVPVFVANPHPWPVRADVEFELEALTAAPLEGSAEDTGAPVPIQRIRSEATLGGRHRRLVLAADLPPLGYRVYRLKTAASAEHATATGTEPPVDDLVLENDSLRVVIDRASGWLSSFVPKRLGAELLGGETEGHAVVLDDPSDTWSHGLVAYDKEIGRFAPLSVRRIESGPVRQVVEVESAFGESRLTERFILGARSAHLEVRAHLDWREQQSVLKLRFPIGIAEAKATFSIPYGQLERPTTGSEEAAQNWVDVRGVLVDGTTAGWAVLNDSKYGFDVDGAEIGMTAARSPIYAWHDPHKPDPEERYDYLDLGQQDFSYALVPHGGDMAAAGVVRIADELNSRPIAIPDAFHPGPLPPAQAHADDGGGPVVMTVFKRAEDGGATVVRAYESAGKQASATLELPVLGRSIDATFLPGEVKTFLIPDDGAPTREVSLLEWPEEHPGAD